MSLKRKHALEHRMIRIRQFPLDDEKGPQTGRSQDQGESRSTSSDGVSAPSDSATPSTTRTSTQQEPTKQTQQEEPPVSSSTSSPTFTPGPITSSSVVPDVTPSSSSSSSSSSVPVTTSSSSSSSSSSSTPSRTSSTLSTTSISQSTSTHTFIATASVPQTSSLNTISRITSSAAKSTVSASDTAPATTGAINTGAIVGGIAGGLVAVAVLGCFIVTILRRRSRRVREERFNAAQFRKSAMIMDDEVFTPTPRPPDMIQNRMNVVPSTGSIVGAGMAGAGAYKFQNPESFEPYHDETPRTAEYGASALAQPPVACQNQPLQPQQKYTFGHGFEPSSAAIGAGAGVAAAVGVGAAAAYTTHDHAEPHATDVYDPEMYGNYHAYSTDEYADKHSGSGAANRDSIATVADDAYGGI